MLEEPRGSVIICRRETPEARKRLNASLEASVSEEPGPDWAELHRTRRPTAHLVQGGDFGASLFLLQRTFGFSHRLSEETGSDTLTTVIVAAALLAFLLLLLLLEGRDGNRMNEWIKEGGIYPDSLVSFGDRLVMSECTDDGRLHFLFLM